MKRVLKEYWRNNSLGLACCTPAGGFTLVEMAVVIVIISIFAVMTIPQMLDVGDSRLKQSAIRISKTITYLRTQALSSGKMVRLEIDIKSGEYFASSPGDSGEYVQVSFPFFKSGKLPKGVTVYSFRSLFGGTADGTALLYFMPSGFTEKAVIVLASGEDKKMSLDINPLTGKVKVTSGELKYRFEEIRALTPKEEKVWKKAS